jgi:Plasmid rolling circle replication initiator protein and truncated derivatives
MEKNNIIKGFSDMIINVEDFEIDKEYIQTVHNNVAYNNVIIDYYKKFYNELGKNRNPYNLSKSRVASLKNCNKFWAVDVYELSSIKDFVSTNLCRDKFCNNCKKVKQASRMSKYIPELEQYKNNLYHLTLTIPNVKEEYLKETVKKMPKAFQRFMRYLSLRSKLGFINLSQYGYRGAIRSLEITFKEDSYHPHYHVALVLNEDIDMTRKHRNTYSTDFLGNREDKLFTDLEIIIQKLWYLCYNDIHVNSVNFNKLAQGYSCNLDKFKENDYAELFKYMTKETDEINNILTYGNFKALYLSTYKLKQIQGYGCLYKISDVDIEDEVNEVYSSIKSFLEYEETPKNVLETQINLLNDNNYTLISRKKIHQYIKK